MPPCGHEIDETLTALVGVQTLDERRILRGDTPVAAADLAAAAEVTAERHERRRGDIAGVSTERNRLDDIGRRADASADDEGDIVADALLAQTLVACCEGKLDGDADIVADACRRSPRAAAEPVDGNDVRTAARDAARDGGDVVHRCDLDDDRDGVVGRFLQGVYELAQILDRVNVVMRCGGDRVRALGDHART